MDALANTVTDTMNAWLPYQDKHERRSLLEACDDDPRCTKPMGTKPMGAMRMGGSATAEPPIR